MSCEQASNFDQWKTFSENYKLTKIWFWIVYKFIENNCHLQLIFEFIQTQEASYLLWLNKYPKISYIKSSIFLWTKFSKNLLLTKYLIPVVAALKIF